MTSIQLGDLQETVRDKSGFSALEDYFSVAQAFLNFLVNEKPTCITSPSNPDYIFYQYNKQYGHKITRPLNTKLLIRSSREMSDAIGRFGGFLKGLDKHQDLLVKNGTFKKYIQSREVNKVVYTLQQSIGGIGDSFENPNQSRKRIGQLFENLIKLILQEIGLTCETRTINLPIPGNTGYKMSYELDVVFSNNKAIIASETKFIHPSEIVGSVKTTSKDRIDKVFLDKYLLSKLLGRDVPVVAVFLNDVQRAKRGTSIFGVNSTFKSNHFLGYTVALNKLDGVYYVDPRPEMISNEKLREQIHDFQQFLVSDLWVLSKKK